MRTVSYPTLVDDDAILTATAGSTSQQVITSLAGVIGSTAINPGRSLTVTTAAAVGGYTASSTVVVEGRDANGATISETFTLTAANGGQTLNGTKAFFKVTKVTIAAQPNTTGSFRVGVKDVMCDSRSVPFGVRVGGAGDLKVVYRDGSVDKQETILANTFLPMSPKTVVADSDTTATKITLYFS